MSTHRFDQVDVFADGAFTGNPLAVVHDAGELSIEQMQNFTVWTNLSEAAFLLPPTDASADYRVRIFEPKSELPFAGHPTLGSCAAWLAAGGVPASEGVVIQQCGAGLVPIRVDDTALAFAAPPMIRHEPVADVDLDRALDTLGLDLDDVVESHWIDNGPGWMGLLLRDAERVRSIEMPSRRQQHFDVGVAGLNSARAHADGDFDLEVRAFFNDAGGTIREDPVTGSLNASLAQWLLASGTLAAPYVARQRTGRVRVTADADTVWVGGAADLRISGEILL